MKVSPVNPKTLGINIDQPVYFSRLKIYEDWGRTSSFYHPNGNGAVVDLDSGHPVSGDTSLTIQHRVGEVWVQGDYTISWDGGGSGPTSKTLSPGDNSENYNYNGNLSGFTFIRDESTGEYTEEFSALAGAANCIRFMDPWRTNYVEFDEDNPWVRITVGASNTFYHRLLTPQDIVDITHEFKCDAWVCMHHLSNSGHWLDVANTLNSCWRTVYVEHSNEHWNSAFPQYQYAKLEYSGLGYTGGEFASIMGYHLDRTQAIGEAFHSVNPTKFICTYGAQFRNVFTWTGAKANAQNAYPDVQAIAIGVYVGGPPVRNDYTPVELSGFTYEEIIDIARTDWLDYAVGGTNQMQAWIDEGVSDGVAILSYEGPSTHLEKDDPSVDDHLAAAANSEFGRALEYEMCRWWNENMKTVACSYRDSGNEDAWSYRTAPLHHPGNPRYEAWRNVASSKTIINLM